MKTLNESLKEEFEELVDEFDFSNTDQNKVDREKLKRIYSELLKHKDNSEDFEKSARTVVNTVISREFSS
jgi:hypothetical protein